MKMEKIETAYGLLLANIQELETALATHFYDALIEQNVAYLGKARSEKIQVNNDKLRDLHLSPIDWQKVFQFALIKGAKEMTLQANHQLTPDAIGYIVRFMIETLYPNVALSILELGSGTGNLAETLLTGMVAKDVTYTGFEVDDLMIDLSASIADILQTQAQFLQMDAVRPQIIEPVDLLLSDLPVGYYPDDEVAGRSSLASQTEHTYAHHLLMAQGVKYLKPDGYAIFIAPADLLSSPQADLLKKWLQEAARIVAVVTLPEEIVTKSHQKAIFILQKAAVSQATPPVPFVFPLTSLTDATIVQTFMSQFRQNMI